jgi:hypothetical protein
MKNGILRHNLALLAKIKGIRAFTPEGVPFFCGGEMAIPSAMTAYFSASSLQESRGWIINVKTGAFAIQRLHQLQ